MLVFHIHRYIVGMTPASGCRVSIATPSTRCGCVACACRHPHPASRMTRIPPLHPPPPPLPRHPWRANCWGHSALGSPSPRKAHARWPLPSQRPVPFTAVWPSSACSWLTSNGPASSCFSLLSALWSSPSSLSRLWPTLTAAQYPLQRLWRPQHPTNTWFEMAAQATHGTVSGTRCSTRGGGFTSGRTQENTVCSD